MKRRTFNKLVASGAATALASGKLTSTALAAPRVIPSDEGRMHVGCQHGRVDETEIAFKARCGVRHIDGYAPKLIPGIGWDLEDALRQEELCAKFGIKIDAYHLPLSSAGIDRVATPNIMLGKSPERDREIEMIQQMIEVSAKVGVRALLYNTTILPVVRTERTPGRGGSSYSTWDMANGMSEKDKLTKAGKVSVDEIYERITYLLDRLLPVAEQFNVQLANHIADPPLPVGYRGITRWNSPDILEGVKRFSSLYDSPSHGFNLCLGSSAEGMKDPNTEIHKLIRYVGRKKQIFNIHLRNIKGGWGYFQEVYPDEGDMDFLEVIKTLREVGYTHMVMPDHLPHHDDDPDARQGFAFAYGYIKALIQAAYS